MVENLIYKLKVFLDTTVLLKGFSAFRKNQPLPKYITDSSVELYTFEKCVFETYMAFRGIGGRKPDEGRGRWAEMNLRGESDPAMIGKLSSQFHDGSSKYAFYWANQILEARCGLDDIEENISCFVISEEQEAARADAEALRKLAKERDKFESLCWEFLEFLEQYNVTYLPYAKVFDWNNRNGFNVDVCSLDSFVRNTALPSEDFEIVYAALTLPADIFVTEDSRLRICAASLGLNYSIGSWTFCAGNEYADKVSEIRDMRKN